MIIPVNKRDRREMLSDQSSFIHIDGYLDQISIRIPHIDRDDAADSARADHWSLLYTSFRYLARSRRDDPTLR